MRPIHWRDSARRDLDDAADWYARQGGFLLESGFIAAVESTSLLIRRHPAAGSTRHADAVTACSRFTARDLEERFGLAPDRAEMLIATALGLAEGGTLAPLRRAMAQAS